MDEGRSDRRTPPRRTLWLLALVVVLLDTLMLGLARWQYQRGVHKENLRAAALHHRTLPPLRTAGALDEQLPEFRPVSVLGHWVGQPLFLDNQVWQQRAGYRVFMAFVPRDDSRCLLVDRGWMPKTFGVAPRWAPTVDAPALLAEVGHWPEARPLLVDGRTVQGMERGELSALLPCRLHPLLLRETTASADGLQRHPVLPPPEEIAKHWSYAGQWLLFTLLLSGAYVVYVVRCTRRSS